MIIQISLPADGGQNPACDHVSLSSNSALTVIYSPF